MAEVYDTSENCLLYGGVDFARISLSELTDYVKELNVLQMPYLYVDSEHMWNVLDGEIGAYFLEVVKDCDLIGMSWYDAGARNFYTSDRPIWKLEDIAGMKIRVQESNMIRPCKMSWGRTGKRGLCRGLCFAAEV